MSRPRPAGRDYERLGGSPNGGHFVAFRSAKGVPLPFFRGAKDDYHSPRLCFAPKVRASGGRTGVLQRHEHGQIARFQVHLPVDMPRPDRVTTTQCGVRSMSIGRTGPRAFLMRFWPPWHAALPVD